MDSLGRPTAAAVADAAVADAAVAAAATAVTAVAVTAVAMAVTTACSSPPAASYVDDEVNTGLDFDEEVGAAVLPLPGVRAAGSGLALPSKPAFHRKARDGEKIDLPPSSEMLAHDLERRKHVSNAKKYWSKKNGAFLPNHARTAAITCMALPGHQTAHRGSGHLHHSANVKEGPLALELGGKPLKASCAVTLKNLIERRAPHLKALVLTRS